MFAKKFNTYACIGDRLLAMVGPLTVEARIQPDNDYNIDDDDSHNIDQKVTGCDDEQQRQLIAARHDWFRGDWRYCGIVLSVKLDEMIIDDYLAAIWGIELNYPGGDNSHLTEIANELLAERLKEIEGLPAALSSRLVGSM